MDPKHFQRLNPSLRSTFLFCCPSGDKRSRSQWRPHSPPSPLYFSPLPLFPFNGIKVTPNRSACTNLSPSHPPPLLLTLCSGESEGGGGRAGIEGGMLPGTFASLFNTVSIFFIYFFFPRRAPIFGVAPGLVSQSARARID